MLRDVCTGLTSKYPATLPEGAKAAVGRKRDPDIHQLGFSLTMAPQTPLEAF